VRKTEREILDRSVIDDIIRKCQICRIGLSDENRPYIVPVNFGYDGTSIYFHSAREGRKLDILKRNPVVCVQFDVDTELVTKDTACGCTMKYRSVIAFGTASIVEDRDGMIEAYGILMGHYMSGPFSYNDKALSDSLIVVVRLDKVTGKMSGY